MGGDEFGSKISSLKWSTVQWITGAVFLNIFCWIGTIVASGSLMHT